MKRLTLDEFIERSNLIHDFKYDYSKVVYINSSTKVEIICPIHGSFWQTPNKHMQGRGCQHMECINMRREMTSLKHYGVKNPAQSDEVKRKMKRTNLHKYGYINAMQNEKVKKHLINSVQEKYGVDCTFKLDEVKDKRKKKTFVQKYGGNSPMCSENVRQKHTQTMLDKYNVEHALQSKEFRQKAKNTVQSHYCVDNVMHNDDIKRKVIYTKRKNHTFHTSKPEDLLYQMLCDVFGIDDVVRQYSSDVYMFACDFYIESRDLYIELNASWTHGGHWFNSCDKMDNEKKQLWYNKQTDYYNSAIYTWTDLDVRKRNMAKYNKLNYVVFWNNNLNDANIWFDLDCPDGCDWNEKYSWLI